jgi:hypothetical protein
MALVKYNNNSISEVTELASLPSGAMTHIKTITASSDSTISFVHGSSDVVFDSTYPAYLFQFNMSVDTGSNYNVTKTSYAFEARNSEGGGTGVLSYNTGRDLSQSTDFQVLTDRFDSLGNDYNVSGELYIFNPSSTTFVKHYIARTNFINSNINYFYHIGGYGNTTSAVDAIQFKFSPSNIDAGTIKLYGIKDS